MMGAKIRKRTKFFLAQYHLTKVKIHTCKKHWIIDKETFSKIGIKPIQGVV